MQEIKKRRIVLASVLKPVNDPRMFEKIGQSLSPNYEVHIIGDSGTTVHDNSSIFLHPLPYFNRISFGRVTAPLRILKKIIAIKPNLLIICTHELLWVVLLARIFVRCRVIYDVQENYYRNIRSTKAFPAIIRNFIALYVRLKEKITTPLINYYLLAEAAYVDELAFIGKKKIVIENKLKRILLPSIQKKSEMDGNIHLLFSGTLAPTTGVFDAIDLASKLHTANEKIRLHIIGFSQLSEVYKKIKYNIRDKPFIEFTAHEKPVDHTEILHEIMRADFGIIAYPSNVATHNRIPTKLYEYMGYQLPILLINHKPWVEICERYKSAVVFDPFQVNPSKMIHLMASTRFYTHTPKEVFWESEETKLLETVARLL
jgi:glycosyltransferase involved in cell wall biosynthesis